MHHTSRKSRDVVFYVLRILDNGVKFLEISDLRILRVYAHRQQVFG